MERIEIGNVGDAARRFNCDGAYIWAVICSTALTIHDREGEYRLYADRHYPGTSKWIVEAVKVG